MKPWLLPLADVCLNLMLVFAVLLRLSVMAINAEQAPPTKPTLFTHALYVIKLEWSGDSKDDLDLYASDPVKHLVFFKRLSDGMMTLEHDDTGSDSNSTTLPNGEVVTSPWNFEQIDIKGIVPGEYVVNVHLYSASSPGPISAVVTLFQMVNGSTVKVHDESVELKEKGDEVTAFRFTLLADGTVVNINRLQKKFVNGNPI
jgi:hypothetical protein